MFLSKHFSAGIVPIVWISWDILIQKEVKSAWLDAFVRKVKITTLGGECHAIGFTRLEVLQQLLINQVLMRFNAIQINQLIKANSEVSFSPTKLKKRL